ncbi:phage portal protein [Cytobacillus firmus]|uniref:phage portal protein n=1 Tax=Cytobacillus firmus TaxID=1399 RepID=UPI0018CC98A8|nr:phage portal protein [Cytobacillus firmus]MBG9548340.1 portal protein [Cytobacillus firmus]MBG9600810.1 portal protein [Cytobacillus firmus]MED1938931.1 phage portal protein [Cytobacillus firmus]
MYPDTPTLTEIYGKMIEEGAKGMITDREIIYHEVKDWENSQLRELMLTGQRYYENEHDILNRKRLVVGEGGELEEVKNIANNKLVHGFVRKLVDQKVGYLLSLPFTIQTNKEEYMKMLTEYFTKKFYRMFQNLGKEAINKGKAWLHIYYDEQGNFRLKRIPSEEIIPLWEDAEHTELSAVIRTYRVEAWIGKKKETIHKVELWDLTGVYRYVVEGNELIPDVEAGDYSPHLVMEKNGEEAQGMNWQRVPFICFKYNNEELPLVNFVKSIVDDYDQQKSDNANNLEELPNGGIYVVRDYDGQDLGEFRRNLAVFRAVKVHGDGGLDTLKLDINTEAFKTHMDMQRKDLYELGRGVDTQNDRFGGDKSGIALRFLYADLDMDANIIETEFQAALEQLKWFIDQDIALKTGQDYSGEDVDFIFNRDITINESEVIENASKSVGQISDETIIANHPWVTDVEEELKRIEKQYSKQEDYKETFTEEVNVDE